MIYSIYNKETGRIHSTVDVSSFDPDVFVPAGHDWFEGEINGRKYLYLNNQLVEIEPDLNELKQNSVNYIRSMTSQIILERYPSYKQINLLRENSTESIEAFKWIDEIRAQCNVFIIGIEVCERQSEIEQLTQNFKQLNK
jgi:hypothetical protein